MGVIKVETNTRTVILSLGPGQGRLLSSPMGSLEVNLVMVVVMKRPDGEVNTNTMEDVVSIDDSVSISSIIFNSLLHIYLNK